MLMQILQILRFQIEKCGFFLVNSFEKCNFAALILFEKCKFYAL